MDRTINVLCSTDNTYVPYCGIMLTSLFENNKCPLNVFIICNNLSKDGKEALASLGKTYGNLITFIHVDEEVTSGFPIRERDHVSLATYYRLFATKILPEDIDRILYLDCDMIINGNIDELYSCDLTDKSMACTLDEDYMSDAKYARLGLSGPKTYFNAGMILINLQYWREHNIHDKCMQCIADIPEKLLLHDQDTLNVVLKDTVKLVSVTYNMQTGLLYVGQRIGDEVKDDIQASIYNPVIIHYTGPRKPWLKHYHHPYIGHFRYYMKKSPWRELQLTTILKEEYRYYRHAVKFFLHLKKYLYIVKRIKVSNKDK